MQTINSIPFGEITITDAFIRTHPGKSKVLFELKSYPCSNQVIEIDFGINESQLNHNHSIFKDINNKYWLYSDCKFSLIESDESNFKSWDGGEVLDSCKLHFSKPITIKIYLSITK